MRLIALLLVVACTQQQPEPQRHGRPVGVPRAGNQPHRGVAVTAWTAVGDSTAKCCNTAGWPVWFATTCTNPQRTMNNQAVAGATTTDIRDSQWPVAKLLAVNGIFVSGGFNDYHNFGELAPAIFGRLQTVADQALAMGWQVVFVKPLPSGGISGASEEAQRLALWALELAWANAHGQQAIDVDKTLINCGDRYSDGALALCDFANTGDLVHPSEGGEAVIGTYIAARLGCLAEVKPP